jgi:hypothetical protein
MATATLAQIHRPDLNAIDPHSSTQRLSPPAICSATAAQTFSARDRLPMTHTPPPWRSNPHSPADRHTSQIAVPSPGGFRTPAARARCPFAAAAIRNPSQNRTSRRRADRNGASAAHQINQIDRGRWFLIAAPRHVLVGTHKHKLALIKDPYIGRVDVKGPSAGCRPPRCPRRARSDRDGSTYNPFRVRHRVNGHHRAKGAAPGNRRWVTR